MRIMGIVLAELLEKSEEFGFDLRKKGQNLNPGDALHLAGYHVADRTRLPEGYCAAADRLSITDKDDKYRVHGGVLFVKEPALFRTKDLTDQEIIYPENSIEMNGLWLHPRVPPSIRVAFWALVCAHLESFHGHIFFSYDTKKKGLAAFYEGLPGDTVYEGPVKAIPGMEGESHERIVRMDAAVFNLKSNEILLRRLTKALKGVEACLNG